MKKRFIRLFVFAMAIVSMGALNSCKDYDEDRVDELSKELADQNATLKELIRLQTESLQNQINGLQAQIDAIHSCDCDVAGAIQAALAEYLKQHPDGPKEADVIRIVTEKITEAMAGKEHHTEAEIKDWIQDAIKGIASCNCEHMTTEQLSTFISTVINKYLADGNYLTAEDIQKMIDASLLDWATVSQLNAAKQELEEALKKATERIGKNENDISGLIATVGELSTAIGTAQARANAAYELAETAAGNAETALKNAETAFNKAKDAEDAAKAAADKAQEAWDKAKNAEDTAGEALKNAEDAFNKAKEALDAATDAAGKAKEALDKAQEAAEQAETNRQNLETLTTELGTLSGTVSSLGETLQTTTETAAKAWALAQANEITLNGMATTLDQLKTKDTELQAQIDELAKQAKNFATQEDVVGALRYAMNLYNEALSYVDQAVADATQALLQKINDEISGVNHRIDDLEELINGIKPCDCDVAGAIEQALQEFLEAHPDGPTEAQVIQIVTEKIAEAMADKEHHTETEIKDWITDAIAAITTCDCEFKTEEQLTNLINSVIEVYLTNNKYVTPTELQEAIDDAINEKNDNLTTIINNAIKVYLEGSDYVTKTELQKAIEDASDKLQKQINTLNSDLTQLLKALGKTNEAIDGLNGRVNTLEDKLNSMITGVVIQGTVNPAFGSFALPMGIKSNMLVTYYGENEHQTFFPTVSTADLVNPQYALTDKDAEMLGDVVDNWSIPGQSTFFNEKEGNAGKVYLTVNPSSTDFTGREFSMVNSLWKEENPNENVSPFTLGALKPSTDKLTFGWTRAGNSLYEASATLKEADIEKAKINFNNSALQEAVQQILNYKMEEGLVFTQIGSALYTAVNNVMDAYAVKAPWTVKDENGNNVENYTLSDFAIGATAIKPLSFAFLHDINLGKIPEINPFSELNIDLNKYIDLDQFFMIIQGAVEEGTDFAKNYDLKLKIQFDTLYIENGTVKTRILYQETDAISEDKVLYESWHNYDVSQIDLLMVEILNQRAAYWSAQLRYEFQKQIMSRRDGLIAKINAAAAKYIGALKAVSQDVIDNLNGAINGPIGNINDYLEKINKFIRNINLHLKNANNKLQVSMYYETADGQYHAVSQDPTWYTTFEGANEVVIYPTTYTAELIAPSYKKFIGITNVFKGDESAQNGNAECKKVLDDTNKAMGLEIMDGDTRAIAFKPAAKGYKYEIFYAALDYSGKISQHKFYVLVK